MAGEDPEIDYRFTLANERTFLAWIRTSLALIAAGVALVQLVPRFGVTGSRHVLSMVLVAAGGALALLAVRQWTRTQDAMTKGADLPRNRLPHLLGGGLTVLTVVLLVLLFVVPPVGA